MYQAKTFSTWKFNEAWRGATTEDGGACKDWEGGGRNEEVSSSTNNKQVSHDTTEYLKRMSLKWKKIHELCRICCI